MAKKPPKPPWSQVQEVAVHLGELLDQMEADASVVESGLTEGPRYFVAQFSKLATKYHTGGEIRVTKKKPKSAWSEVLESAVPLKDHLDMIAEDTDVETLLWHNARVLTNRLIRLAKKELGEAGAS